MLDVTLPRINPQFNKLPKTKIKFALGNPPRKLGLGGLLLGRM